ncbi:hypothetical protein GCM10011581_15120 [Saccharopolyspora subtropica]|uniref:Uncharacterized protein n=1 Tax=Saccharopolyspora thermophila TaxID=89367 RepID=A0A917JNH6_9PSEU|nr:hypothetical protein [Saccharopolyspora subtropica]GGI78966.1 hypothetical protein GCM10011581_15120 [Saccharopolyspora subtropica]
MRGRFLGDLMMVLVVPLVLMVLSAFVLAVVLAQGWGLHTIFE